MFRPVLAAAAIAFIGINATIRCSPRTSVDGTAEGRWNGSETEFLVLRAGELTGSDGCNGMSGSYTAQGAEITIARGLSTLMACPGVDTWLRAATRARIEGDTMTVFDRDGRQIGILNRAD